ncbi:hypothetical protein [Kineococcus glutinatus]|uniref:LSDAT prokaryote domain-containing protein n=1 Tax=Kineococcus glutinatus TaxID=1070872 RepID=A0ABP9H847_9ACTN
MDADRAHQPPYVRIGSAEEIAGALSTLGQDRNRAVLVCVGGASGLAGEHRALLDDLLRTTLLPLLQQLGAAVVDGGTDAGLMQALGRARAAVAPDLALLGVAAEGTVAAPAGEDTSPQAVHLEPAHTAAVLVPGQEWGQESPWLAELATTLAGDRCSLTLVVNGGDITLSDIEHSLARRRPVLVLQGSGRTADLVAVARRAKATDERIAAIAASPLLKVVAIDDAPALRAAVLDALQPPPASPASP